jgi:hypothetical protein
MVLLWTCDGGAAGQYYAYYSLPGLVASGAICFCTILWTLLEACMVRVGFCAVNGRGLIRCVVDCLLALAVLFALLGSTFDLLKVRNEAPPHHRNWDHQPLMANAPDYVQYYAVLVSLLILFVLLCTSAILRLQGDAEGGGGEGTGSKDSSISSSGRGRGVRGESSYAMVSRGEDDEEEALGGGEREGEGGGG